MTANIKWLKTRCPICGREYEHPEDYKPKTCGDYDCIRKQLHPKLNMVRG